MAGRRLAALGVVALVVAATAATAGAVTRAGGPTAADMVIAASDLPGSKVLSQKATKGSDVIDGEYQRELLLSRPYGASKFVLYFNIAILIKDEPIAELTYREVAKAYSSPKGRAALFAQFSSALGKGKSVKLTHVTTHALPLGDSGMESTLVATAKGRRFDVSFALFRLDRVIEIGFALGTGAAAHPADAVALGKLALGHATAALAPVSSVPPAIAGTAQQGQTLSADTGTWTNAPTTYGYQWQHCDASGANCTDIAGATTATYAVTAADVGTTLRVNVTATNSVGASQPASSAVTAVVT